MSTYTEFNKDMFLCNSFETNQSNTVYSNKNNILYSNKNIKNATFYNITKVSKPLKDELKKHYIENKKNEQFSNNDISAELYKFLKDKKNKYTYDDFQKSPNDTWIYTFGKVVTMNLSAKTIESSNKIEINREYI